MSLKSRQNAFTAMRTSPGPGTAISTLWISRASVGAASRAATQALASTGAADGDSAMFGLRQIGEQIRIAAAQAFDVRLPHVRQIVLAVHELAAAYLGVQDLGAAGGFALEVVARARFERQRLDG